MHSRDRICVAVLGRSQKVLRLAAELVKIRGAVEGKA
jgi:hypothetical protein